MRNLLIPLILAVVSQSSFAVEIYKDRATPISSVPYIISSPGIYYLANDITSSNPNAKITITASNVVLDLAGHTLRVATQDECILIEGSPPAGTLNLFWVGHNGSINVTVQNGTLMNTVAGCIFMGAVHAGIIDHVTMIAAGQNAFTDELGFFNRISNCMLSAGNPQKITGPFPSHGYSDTTVDLFASGDVFENNIVTASWIHGGALRSASSPDGGDISNSGNAILNNVLWSFGYFLMYVSPLDVSSGNQSPGIPGTLQKNP
jgi:hypothetical protein